MKFDEKNVSMIKALSDAAGPSGFEDDVLDVVRGELKDICSFEEDKLRNLYIYRKEHDGSKPVLMLDAHGDEVGFMIHSVKPNGTLRFVLLGGMDPKGLAGSKVMVSSISSRASGPFRFAMTRSGLRISRSLSTLISAAVTTQSPLASI